MWKLVHSERKRQQLLLTGLEHRYGLWWRGIQNSNIALFWQSRAESVYSFQEHKRPFSPHTVWLEQKVGWEQSTRRFYVKRGRKTTWRVTQQTGKTPQWEMLSRQKDQKDKALHTDPGHPLCSALLQQTEQCLTWNWAGTVMPAMLGQQILAQGPP